MIACCRVITLSFFFVHRKCDLWNASSAKSPDGRSVWRHATRDGERRQTGRKFSWGLVWGALLAMRSNDRELFPSSAGRFAENKKSCCSVLIRRAPAPKRRADSDSCSRDGPSLCFLGCALAIDSLLFCVIFLLEWMPVSLCRC